MSGDDESIAHWKEQRAKDKEILDDLKNGHMEFFDENHKNTTAEAIAEYEDRDARLEKHIDALEKRNR